MNINITTCRNWLKEIHQLSCEVAISNISQLKDGFLISGYSLAEYSRLDEAGHLFCATLQETLAGFAVALPWNCPNLAGLREVVSAHIDVPLNLERDNNAIWFDQLATSPQFRRVGVAGCLFDKLLELYPQSIFISAIVEKPFFNEASVQFHLTRRFRRISTFTIPEFKGLSPYQSGIFLLERI